MEAPLWTLDISGSRCLLGGILEERNSEEGRAADRNLGVSSTLELFKAKECMKAPKESVLLKGRLRWLLAGGPEACAGWGSENNSDGGAGAWGVGPESWPMYLQL